MIHFESENALTGANCNSIWNDLNCRLRFHNKKYRELVIPKWPNWYTSNPHKSTRNNHWLKYRFKFMLSPSISSVGCSFIQIWIVNMSKLFEKKLYRAQIFHFFESRHTLNSNEVIKNPNFLLNTVTFES